MNNAAFEMLIACFGACGYWILWFYFIKEYRISSFREQLFAIRDKLFAIAADGEVSFEDPAYIELRVFVNGMIRLAHRVTFLTLITSVKSQRRFNDDSNPYQRWKSSLASLPVQSRERLEQIHADLFSAFMNQLVGGSVVLRPISFALLIAFSLRIHFKKFFSTQDSQVADAKVAMVNDLARTLNAQVLEEKTYRDWKTQEMELTTA